MRLIQIVPELPPAVGGIGDYASLLAKELERQDVRTTFVIPDRERQAQVDHRGVLTGVSPVLPRPQALAHQLDALRPDAVLLHYSGYGFAQRGAPLWLVRGLRRWKASARGGRRLVVMFHEIYTEHHIPWRSSFWLSPLRRRIAQGLAGVADACVTNCLHYQRLLRRLHPGLGEVPVLPVPSNVGEPAKIKAFLEREPIAVVFGQPPRRLDVYKSIAAFLPVLQRAGVRAIEDVGPQLPSDAHDALPWPVRVHGIEPPERVSDLLGRARFGLLRLPAHLLGKSGCFAGFAAHGIVCLLRDDYGPAPSQLVDTPPAIKVPSPAPEALDEQEFGAVGSAAFQWYAGHRAESSAQHFARILRPCAC